MIIKKKLLAADDLWTCSPPLQLYRTVLFPVRAQTSCCSCHESEPCSFSGRFLFRASCNYSAIKKNKKYNAWNDAPREVRRHRRPSVNSDPYTWTEKFESFERKNLIRKNKRKFLTHATHVNNGWKPAVYMSCMSKNFRLFHASNLSDRNFRIFLLMYSYTGSAFHICFDIIQVSSTYVNFCLATHVLCLILTLVWAFLTCLTCLVFTFFISHVIEEEDGKPSLWKHIYHKQSNPFGSHQSWQPAK